MMRLQRMACRRPSMTVNVHPLLSCTLKSLLGAQHKLCSARRHRRLDEHLYVKCTLLPCTHGTAKAQPNLNDTGTAVLANHEGACSL